MTIRLRHFKLREFDSPDEPGSGHHMDMEFVQALDHARAIAETPFKITSGYRSKAHNAKVGGIPSSAHRKGLAADIEARRPRDAARILTALYYVGLRRFGYYPGRKFIHVDADGSKPTPAFWDG